MDPRIYARRRERVAREMERGIAVIPTAPERIRNRDAHYPFRYDSYFYYLTGFREPEAVLVLIAGAEPRSILFCREKNEEREIWDGYRYGPEHAREAFAMDEAHAIARLDELMPDLLADQPAVFCRLGADPDWDARVMRWLNDVRGRVRTGVAAPQAINDVNALLDAMRVVKD
ncbi:MAG: aminopeptidase P N-terminal domain-containing protein, partial [Burkholderiales bacterium]